MDSKNHKIRQSSFLRPYRYSPSTAATYQNLLPFTFLFHRSHNHSFSYIHVISVYIPALCYWSRTKLASQRNTNLHHHKMEDYKTAAICVIFWNVHIFSHFLRNHLFGPREAHVNSQLGKTYSLSNKVEAHANKTWDAVMTALFQSASNINSIHTWKHAPLIAVPILHSFYVPVGTNIITIAVLSIINT